MFADSERDVAREPPPDDFSSKGSQEVKEGVSNVSTSPKEDRMEEELMPPAEMFLVQI